MGREAAVLMPGTYGRGRATAFSCSASQQFDLNAAKLSEKSVRQSVVQVKMARRTSTSAELAIAASMTAQCQPIVQGQEMLQ